MFATAAEFRDELFRRIDADLFPARENYISYKDGFCRYRDENGRKCFAGVCIPDNKYNQEIEGYTFKRPGTLEGQDETNVERFFSYFELPPEVTKKQMIELQFLHDSQGIDDFVTKKDYIKKRINEILELS